MDELSAERIWRWSRAAETNAPVWSRQAWGTWRLGHSLDIKNTEMSQTGRFGFDAADAKGHLGAALGEAVTKLRAHMSGFAANTGDLKSAMERVAERRGGTHTELERLWKRYEATPDLAERGEIEKEMRDRYAKFADDYRDEAASVPEFNAYTGVRKPVDRPTHNSDRLGDNGESSGGASTGSGRAGGPSSIGSGYGSTSHHTGQYGAVEPSGPELQTTAPAATGGTITPNPPPTTGTFHTPAQPTVAPVIGGRTGLPVYGGSPSIPRPNPSGLVNPVNHGARSTPAVPRPRATGGTPSPGARAMTGAPSGSAPRGAAPKPAIVQSRQTAKLASPHFRREGGIRAPIQGAKGKPDSARGPRRSSAAADAVTASEAGERTTEWTVDRATVDPVIRGHRTTDDHQHDPGTVAGRSGMRPRRPRISFDYKTEE